MSIVPWLREKIAFYKALKDVEQIYGKPQSPWDRAEQHRKARELIGD